MQLTLDTLDDTRALGARLAAGLRPGESVMLQGGLGAGKTTLARAIIAARCGVEDAPSPTYTLVQAYETASGEALWHADLYRIEAEEELEELGLDEAFEEAVCLVEWPERLGDYRPPNRLDITLRTVPSGDGERREAVIAGFGSWEDRVETLRR